MCKLFDEWSNDIRRFCLNNNYDFEKAKKLSQSWGKDMLVLQYYDPEKGKNGLLDETPMPLVLLIQKTDTGLVFEQTEYTKKYIGIAS
ncbi:MAG: hypothetical protein IJ192_09865 [Clostridia bacterium]|nr:hypothetical protein [Clostridia bacterium]